MGGHRGTPVAADLSLRGLGFHLLSTHGLDSLQEHLIGRAVLGAIALVGALAIVKPHVAIQVALQLVQRFVERLVERHTVELLTSNLGIREQNLSWKAKTRGYENL